ncbi:hypothetical protein J4732_22100 [Serratia marcescens]|uniref:Uncharacterized protein n=1 Tax=Serratia marcescens TaxID=615 RepID=A0A939NQJ9_SERMA|nr:hypothetical protein [Serratia marcescens]
MDIHQIKRHIGKLSKLNLMSLFNDPLVVRRIYDSAKQIGEFDDYYHQQIAIFEMKGNPNFRLAEQHLDIAAEIAPYNPTINHTRSGT